MNKRWPAMATAVLLCSLQIVPATAQTPTGQTAAGQADRSPKVIWNSGFLRGDFRPGSVSDIDPRDTPRIGDLIRAGQLYLSLQDAISLALENNLDLELERYAVRMGTADTYRAQGGGTLRGVPLSVKPPVPLRSRSSRSASPTPSSSPKARTISESRERSHLPAVPRYRCSTLR
jgi:hypothetical protein